MRVLGIRSSFENSRGNLWYLILYYVVKRPKKFGMLNAMEVAL